MSSNNSNNDEKVPLDLDDDYYFSRQTYYELLRIGMEKLNGCSELAEESEHPRAYEVLYSSIKNLADVNDRLIELQEKMKKLEPNEMKSIEKDGVIEGKAISTDELLRQIEKLENDKSNSDQPDEEG